MGSQPSSNMAATSLAIKPDLSNLIDDVMKTEAWKKFEIEVATAFLKEFGKMVSWTLEKAFDWAYNWIKDEPSLWKKGLKVCGIFLILVCVLIAGYYFGGGWGLGAALGGQATVGAIAVLNKMFGPELLETGE